MKKSELTLHKTAVFSMFLMGESGMLIPIKNGGNETFLGFLLAIGVCGALLLFTKQLIRAVKGMKPSAFKKGVSVTAFFAVALYCLYLSVICFKSFIAFVSSYVLPDFSKLSIGLVFILVIALLVGSKLLTLYKFGVVCSLISAVLLGILFLFSVSQFSAENIFLFSPPDINGLFIQLSGYSFSVFLPCLLLPFFELSFCEGQKSAAYKGYLSGAVFLTVAILNSLFIFGNELSAKLDFPYSEAIATVTAGNIFTRMDGFSYMVFFFSCLIKISLCLKLFTVILKRGAVIAQGLKGGISL